MMHIGKIHLNQAAKDQLGQVGACYRVEMRQKYLAETKFGDWELILEVKVYMRILNRSSSV